MLKKILNSLKSIIKRERSPLDVWYFLQGHLREMLYYSKCRFFIRKHIREQFEWRLQVMDKKCFQDGQCKICGCDIPALTLSDKQCEGKCYYPMMTKRRWKEYQEFLNKVNSFDNVE